MEGVMSAKRARRRRRRVSCDASGLERCALRCERCVRVCVACAAVGVDRTALSALDGVTEDG